MTDVVLTRRAAALRASRLDLWVFIVAFLVGLALYLTLRWLGYPQLVQTTAVVSVLVTYALIAVQVPLLRVRLDQAGDNAYYLGLLFTLESMAVALYEFGSSVSTDGASGAEEIIGNFGIALASTIAGIFLRVVLHQMRVDPADVEGVTRIELADASQRVRASLDLVTSDLARFHLEVGQRATDVIATAVGDASRRFDELVRDKQDAMDQWAQAAAASQEAVLSRARALVVALEEAAVQTLGAAERLRAVEPPPLTFSRRLDKAATTVDELISKLDEVVRAFEGAGARTSVVISDMTAASGKLSSVAQEIGVGHDRTAKMLQESVNGVSAALVEVGTALGVSQKLLSDLEAQSGRTAEEALRVQNAATEVLKTLTRTVRDLAGLIRGDDEARLRGSGDVQR